MNIKEQYEIYCIHKKKWAKISYNAFYNRLKKLSFEEAIYLDYKITRSSTYKNYLKWCNEMKYTPFSKNVFLKRKDIYTREHKSILDNEFNRGDRVYIDSLPKYNTVQKIGINQYIVLFYKNYFKRRYG